MGYEVKIGLSNKHLHLQKEHIEILFGKGHELTPTKPLVQPGQFACEEKVDIVGPKTVKLCTLLDKPAGRRSDVQADYVGFEVEDLFIIGYGLDYDQKYRNLRYISYLNE